MLSSIMHFHKTITRLYDDGAPLDAMMATLRPQIAEINNYKWMEDEEFNSKYPVVTERLDSVTYEEVEANM